MQTVDHRLICWWWCRGGGGGGGGGGKWAKRKKREGDDKQTQNRRKPLCTKTHMLKMSGENWTHSNRLTTTSQVTKSLCFCLFLVFAKQTLSYSKLQGRLLTTRFCFSEYREYYLKATKRITDARFLDFGGWHLPNFTPYIFALVRFKLIISVWNDNRDMYLDDNIMCKANI